MPGNPSARDLPLRRFRIDTEQQNAHSCCHLRSRDGNAARSYDVGVDPGVGDGRRVGLALVEVGRTPSISDVLDAAGTGDSVRTGAGVRESIAPDDDVGAETGTTVVGGNSLGVSVGVGVAIGPAPSSVHITPKSKAEIIIKPTNPAAVKTFRGRRRGEPAPLPSSFDAVNTYLGGDKASSSIEASI